MVCVASEGWARRRKAKRKSVTIANSCTVSKARRVPQPTTTKPIRAQQQTNGNVREAARAGSIVAGLYRELLRAWLRQPSTHAASSCSFTNVPTTRAGSVSDGHKCPVRFAPGSMRDLLGDARARRRVQRHSLGEPPTPRVRRPAGPRAGRFEPAVTRLPRLLLRPSFVRASRVR